MIFFSTDLFDRAGLDDATAQSATLGMGGMNVLMTIISVILVEKAGRKTLQLVGMSGMFVVTVLLTICLALKVRSIDRPLKNVLDGRCIKHPSSLPHTSTAETGLGYRQLCWSFDICIIAENFRTCSFINIAPSGRIFG